MPYRPLMVIVKVFLILVSGLSACATDTLTYLRAVQSGDLELAKAEFESGRSPINGAPGRLHLPLHESARLGYPPVAQYLLEKGALVDLQNRFGATPLHLAVCNEAYHSDSDLKARVRYLGQQAVAQLLLARGANPNTAAHGWEMGSVPACGGLISINLGRMIGSDDRDITPLMLAAATGNVQGIETLLKSGASPHARTTKGWTALHFAVLFPNVDAAKPLLDAGAQPYPLDGKAAALAASALAHLFAAIQKLDKGGVIDARRDLESSLPLYEKLVRAAQAEGATHNARTALGIGIGVVFGGTVFGGAFGEPITIAGRAQFMANRYQLWLELGEEMPKHIHRALGCGAEQTPRNEDRQTAQCMGNALIQKPVPKSR